MEDLSAASEEDVKSFFRLYYAPNNAYLTIVGDIDPAQAKALVDEILRRHAARQTDPRPTAQPVTLDSARTDWCSRIACRCRASISQWPTVGENSDDRFALSVLGAILSGPRTARLTKALVYDQQAAASVNAGQNTKENVGEFVVTITPRPGTFPDGTRDAADAVIERLKREGPTAEEIQKATAGEEFVRSRAPVQSREGIQLADGAAIHGDPGVLPHGVSEDAGGDGGRSPTRGQQIFDGGPNRAERRPDGTNRSGIEAGRKQRSSMTRRVFVAIVF